MEDRYGGESVGKKLARFNFWERASAWMGADFLKTRHLVLASREGGDISVLRGLGVSPKNIVAVERNSRAVGDCQKRHPEVRVIHGDVVAVARRNRLEIGVALLDFCSWPTDEALDCVFGVAAHALKNSAVLGYAFLRGREPKNVFSQMAKLSEVEQRQQAEQTNFLSDCGAVTPDSARRFPADGRSKFIFDSVQGRLTPLRVGLFTLAQIGYHSSCAWRRGVPMQIWAKWVMRAPELSQRSFEKRCASVAQHWLGALQVAEAYSLPPEGERQVRVSWEKDRHALVPTGVTFDREFISMASLVAAARSLDEIYPGQAHLLLNISPGRLAAWRAHATRGTYGKVA